MALAQQVRDMTVYSCNKLVSAVPMNRGDYNAYRGWITPTNEDASDEGYLVENLEGASNHPDHMGAITWTGKLQFDYCHLSIGEVGLKPDFRQRLLAEQVELDTRIHKLSAFTRSDRFLKLPYPARELLLEQCRVMTRYNFILHDRIAMA